MFAIYTLALMGAAFTTGWVLHKAPPPPPPPERTKHRIHLTQTMDLIDHAAETVRAMRHTQDMITCAESGQAVRAEWIGGHYTLTTARTLGYVEQTKLLASLLQDIDALCAMRVDGVTPSVTLSERCKT